MHNTLQSIDTLQSSAALHRPLATCAVAAVMALTSLGFAQAKSLRIENKRRVALVELIVSPKGEPASQQRVMARDLGGGRAMVANVPPGNCLFDVRGSFADQTTLEAADMDLCRQHTLRLVE